MVNVKLFLSGSVRRRVTSFFLGPNILLSPRF